MCGRYTLTNPAKLFENCPWVAALPQPVLPRYNIAPGQLVMMVAGPAPYGFTQARWGLSARFSGEAKASRPLMNARRETVLEKPTFQHWFRTQRCLIPADGFYEWPARNSAAARIPARRGPFYFVRRDGGPFAFAGFFVPGIGPHGQRENQCVILTAPAVALVSTVHPRMPVILSQQAMKTYLQCDPEKALLDSLAIDMNREMRMYRVGAAVNGGGVDGPVCVRPAESGPADEDETKLLF